MAAKFADVTVKVGAKIGESGKIFVQLLIFN